MADSINIPIKIIDEATGTLAKIQTAVERFQKNLSGVGKAASNVENVNREFKQVDATIKKATKSNERLLESSHGMEAFLRNIDAGVKKVKYSQTQTNETFEALKTKLSSVIQPVKTLVDRLKSTKEQANQTTTCFDRMYTTIRNITKSGAFKSVRSTLQDVNEVIKDENSLFRKTQLIISTIKRSISQKKGLIDRAQTAQRKFNKSVTDGKTQVNSLIGNVKGLIATYAGFESVKGIVGLSDQQTNIGARLDMINDGSQTTAELQNKIFKAAENSRGSYADMADSVAKLQLLTGDAFKSNDEAITFTSNLQKMFAVCGTDSQQASSAMLQLTQALGSGVLQGDEFKSIMESCPMIVHTLAKHMGVPVGEMKKLGSEGKITTQIMRSALLGATDEINEKFQKMPFTWAQIWTSIKNGFTKTLQPALEKINEVFNKHKEKISSFADSMSKYVGKIVQELVVFGEALISLMGNSGVQTFIQSIVYVFTGFLRTVTKLLTPLAKFLGYLDQLGILGPILTTLGGLFIFYAMTVNTATIAIKVFTFVMTHMLNILKGVKIALNVIRTVFIGIKVAIGWVVGAVKALGVAMGVSFGWAIVIVLAVIAVIALLVYYWDEVKAAAIWCWEGIKSAAIATWDWMKNTWGTFSEWFSGIWESAKNGAISLWTSIKNGAISAWESVKNSAISIWQSIWGAIGPLVTALWNFIFAVFRGGQAIISAIMTGIWNWLVYAWNAIYGFVVPIISAIWTWIVTKFQAIWQSTVSIFTAIKDWFVSVWNSIYSFVAPIVSSIYNWISQKFHAVYTFTQSIWNSVKQAVVEKVIELYNKVKEWIDKVVNYFSDLREKMIQKGKDFIQGFIDGVTSMIKKATDTVTEFCDNAVDAINNFFKIGSPSKVMRELGGFVGEGFNLGLEDQIKQASMSAKRLSMSTLQGASSSTSKRSSGAVSSPNITINVHNSISGEGDVKKIVDKITVLLTDALNTNAKGVYNYV